MMISSVDLGDILDVLVEKAPALREAGVARFGLGSVGVSLLPPDVKEEVSTQSMDEMDTEGDAFIDPMNDPASYPDGRVPGFSQIQELREQGKI